MNNCHSAKLFLATACLGLMLAATDAAAFASGRVLRQNSSGGVTGGSFHAGRGPNGGGFASGRAINTDGAGNGSVVSGGAFRAANGTTGARAGKTTWNADGSASHQSGFRASGAKGSAQSSGSATRSADGTVNQSRTTTATSSATGDTRSTTESCSSGNGVTRTTTCTDAAGNTIACAH